MSADRSHTLTVLQFLRSVDEFRLPEGLDGKDEAAILERLVDEKLPDAWPVEALERERWINHVLERLNRGEIEYRNRSFYRPLAELLDELSEEAADLGAWGAIATYALNDRGDLEHEVREMLAQAIRDVAAAGATAWARIDQAKLLLARIDERGTQQR